MWQVFIMARAQIRIWRDIFEFSDTLSDECIVKLVVGYVFNSARHKLTSIIFICVILYAHV